jgi:hypothetical protein
MAKVLLTLVTYEVASAYMPKMAISRGYERSNWFTVTATSCIRTSGQVKKMIFDYAGQSDTPRVCRISSVDAFPSARSESRTTHILIRLVIRTFHYYLHIIDQTVDNVKGLRDSRLRLLKSESIKP